MKEVSESQKPKRNRVRYLREFRDLLKQPNLLWGGMSEQGVDEVEVSSEDQQVGQGE